MTSLVLSITTLFVIFPKNKLKDYYSIIISKKAQLPNKAKKLRQIFNLIEKKLKFTFTLPYSMAFEPYVKAFQHKHFKFYTLYKQEITENWILWA